MTAVERSARQSAVGHATRPDRIEAVTRDLVAGMEFHTDKEHR